MPRKQPPSEKADNKASGPKPQADQPESPKAKTPEQEFEERPDIQFARDFDRDLTFAFQWEVAQEMESELEDELERALQVEANAEPWGAQLMRQSWSADPQPRHLDDYNRFRMTPAAYEAMKVGDPMEAMLFAQASALHTNMIFALSQATRLGQANPNTQASQYRGGKTPSSLNPDLAARYFTIATKLAAAYGKHMDTLQRYRTKGQQKVVVKYERQSGSKVSRSEKHRLTVSKSGGMDSDFSSPVQTEEPVPVRRSNEGAASGGE